MNAGPTGFAGAPVTKGLLVCVTGSSVLVQASHSLRGQLPRLLRSAGHLLIFEHPGVLIFGTALLYYFRLFERQWGSNKYGTFTAFVFGSAYVLEQAAIKLLGWIPAPIPGPFPLIFANYVPFFFDVPATQRFQLFGLPLTDKVRVLRHATGRGKNRQSSGKSSRSHLWSCFCNLSSLPALCQQQRCNYLLLPDASAACRPLSIWQAFSFSSHPHGALCWEQHAACWLVLPTKATFLACKSFR